MIKNHYRMYSPKDRHINILLHVLIWSLITILLFLYPTLAHKGVDLPDDFTLKQIVHLCLMLAAYYLNAYVLVPQFLLNSKYLLFAFAIAVFVFLSAYILASVENWLNLKEQMEHIWGKRQRALLFDRFGFLTTLITLGISTSIAAINKLNQDNKERLRAEKEHVATELSILKAQIHPHFFFNTLNSIYSLSFTDAERSRKVLMKLSNIMRYLLYETNEATTSVGREIAFISDYVEIMKLRLNTWTSVQLNLPEKVLPMPIAPMILMPYVENVFKHGVDESENNELFIGITQNAKGLQLVTRNRIATKPALVAEGSPGGIGMRNTQRRLELIYKNRYQLSAGVLPSTNEFELKLEITLL